VRQQKGGDIIVLASGSIIRRLLQADALDRLSITLCPEVAGGGARLFEDGLPPSSWTLRQSTVTESGALCLLYDRVREGK
jgi:dihydrofolate reductase